MQSIKSFNLKTISLVIALCTVYAGEGFANGCSGSSFTLTYSPFCGCWQLCGGYGNALLVSDCDDLTDLSINWGDGSPSYSFSLGGALPCHPYLPGTYTATLHIEGYCHNIFSTTTCNITQQVTVSPSTLEFDANFFADTVCLGAGTSFSNASLVAPGVLNLNWYYDYGDGATSLGNPNPVHQYNQCGAYDVMLIITGNMLCCDQDGRDTIIKRVYVNCPPNSNSNALGLTDPYIYESSASATANEVCQGDITNYILTKSDSIIYWQYTFSDTGSSLLANPAHQFINCTPAHTNAAIQVTNTRNCTSFFTQPAIVHCAVYGFFSGVSSVLCYRDCNGIATLNIVGGEAPYSFTWSDPNIPSTPNATNLCAGPLAVTVTDVYGCWDSSSITIDEPALLTGTVNVVNNNCVGLNNGSATINPSGGTVPYSYYWSPNGEITPSITGLAAGQFCTSVTDVRGCVFDTCVIITQPPEITITQVVNDANCGFCDGSATVSAVGGTGPYTYAWVNGQSGATAINLCAGIELVTVTDANGCSRQFPIGISSIGGLAVTVTPVNSNCATGCNGSASVVPCACSYEWINPSGTVIGTASSVAGLCAGNYISRVTNLIDNCQTLTNFSITIPTPIVISTTPTGSCLSNCDGRITVAVSGGAGAFTYQWFDGSNTLIPAQTNATITDLCPGTYYAEATDQTGCVARDTAIVEQYNLSGSSTSIDLTCNGACTGSITAIGRFGSPPYVYIFQNSAGTTVSSGPQIAGSLCADTYSITVTDNHNCFYQLPNVVISQPAAIVPATVGATLLCNGDCNGSVSVNVTGGVGPYGYLWADSLFVPIPGGNTPTLGNQCIGTYSVRVTDANNCVTPYFPALITQPSALSDTLIVTQPHCGNGGLGAIDLTVSGGTPSYSYSWTGGAITEDISGITTPGQYCVTITDGNGCALVDCATIQQFTPLNTLISSPSRNGFHIDCAGDSTGVIYLQVTGGLPLYSYQWDDPRNTNNDTVTWLQAGTYNVTVTDFTGCTATNTITLLQPPPLLLAHGETDNLCAGDSSGIISINLSGGVPVSVQLPYAIHWESLSDSSYLITNTSATLTGLPAGQYYVYAFDTMGCVVRDTMDIIDPLPVAASFSIVNGSCNGTGDGSINLTPGGGTGPYTVAWSWSTGTSANEDLTGLAPDSYFVTVTDVNNCTALDTALVILPVALATTITAVPTTCFDGTDGSIDLTVTGGSPLYSYAWNIVPDTTEDLSGIPSGNYTVVVTDQGGCTITTGIFVDQPPPLFGTGAIQICNGDSALLGGVWQKFNGIYPDTVTTVAGCDSFVDVTLTLVDSFLLSLSPVLCFGESFVVNGNSYTTTGTYREDLLSSGGCDSIVVTNLTVLPEIGLHTNPLDTATVIKGDSITIVTLTNPGVTIQDYVWTPDAGINCTNCASAIAVPVGDIVYTIVASIVQDTVTCYDTTSVELFVDSVTQVGIYIPNAFTPNGDGVNDFFMVYGYGFARFRLIIFDRWGDKLFETRDQTTGWDGTYRGKKLNPGVYVYYVDIDFINGISPKEYIEYRKGSVTLIR